MATAGTIVDVQRSNMGTATRVARVWIEPGCIRCGWCSDLAPEVFQGSERHETRINGAIRSDGMTDDNRAARSLLLRPLLEQQAEFMEFVADGCPAHVIKLD